MNKKLMVLCMNSMILGAVYPLPRNKQNQLQLKKIRI